MENNMENNMNIDEDIKNYLIDLEDDDVRVRNVARWHLASIGPEAVPDLINQLKTDKERCRWEAAKILGEIRDDAAAEALVEALLDNSISVHWVATEALIKYGQKAILPLLEGLTRHFDSMRFRQGAYHILHVFEQFHHLESHVQKVLDALRDIEPSVTVPWAAERAIEYYLYQK
jgi:HEAT repeat protein